MLFLLGTPRAPSRDCFYFRLADRPGWRADVLTGGADLWTQDTHLMNEIIYWRLYKELEADWIVLLGHPPAPPLPKWIVNAVVPLPSALSLFLSLC